MSDATIITALLFALMSLSYIPVNRNVGGQLEQVMLIYILGLGFRSLCILGSFLNGAQIEALVALVLAIIFEVAVLYRMSMAEEKREALA